MATAAPDIGTGTTFTWSTMAGNVLGVRWGGIHFDTIKTSHMGTTTAHTFMKTDLYDGGTVTLDVQFPMTTVNLTSALGTAASTLTITLPGSSTLAATAILTDYEVTVPLEELMTASLTFKISGAVTYT